MISLKDIIELNERLISSYPDPRATSARMNKTTFEKLCAGIEARSFAFVEGLEVYIDNSLQDFEFRFNVSPSVDADNLTIELMIKTP